MFTKRFSRPGTAPATLTPFAPGEALKPTFRLIEYGPENVEEQEIESLDLLTNAPSEG
ncbi:MAG: hypothetical protein RLZZ253_1801, partial [Verrucomicrobiota bacterium]